MATEERIFVVSGSEIKATPCTLGCGKTIYYCPECHEKLVNEEYTWRSITDQDCNVSGVCGCHGRTWSAASAIPAT